MFSPCFDRAISRNVHEVVKGPPDHRRARKTVSHDPRQYRSYLLRRHRFLASPSANFCNDRIAWEDPLSVGQTDKNVRLLACKDRLRKSHFYIEFFECVTAHKKRDHKSSEKN